MENTASFLPPALSYDPKSGPIPLGLPYGAKPRLFQSFVCTKAIKHQSRVIPVARSMTAMIHELGFDATGGKQGTISGFKEQITRFARCRFDIVITDTGKQRYIKGRADREFRGMVLPERRPA